MAVDRNSGQANKTPEEMFQAGLRELISRHMNWSKPPSREFVTKILRSEATSLLAQPKKA
jgi:hypothetical protein